MDPPGPLLTLASLILILGTGAFFVAADLALARVRRARVEQFVRDGRRGARRLLAALEQPADVTAVAQLAAAGSSVALGFLAAVVLYDTVVGMARLAPALQPSAGLTIAGLTLATVAAVGIVAAVQVILGRQLPAVLTDQRAEAVALATVPTARLIGLALRPLTRVLERVTAGLTRLIGLSPADVHALAASPEELRALVERSQEGGEIAPAEEQMIKGVIGFGDLVAREVMTPRRAVVALPVEASSREVLDVVAREAHSRFPVYAGSLDEIVGVLLVKDLVPHLLAGETEVELRNLMREPFFIPDGKPVSEVLAALRAQRLHMAVVLDEFGGTEGIVTLEDLLEPIVGDIADEYDLPEPESLVELPGGDVLIDGGVGVPEVNERLALDLPEDDFDTVGGLVFGQLGRLPRVGDRVALDGASFLVETVRERRIVRLRMTRRRADAAAPPADSSPTAVPAPP